MIKARKGDAVIFGLDANNIERLKAGHPIPIHMEDIGGGVVRHIMIMYGETMGDIVNEFKTQGLLPPDFKFEPPKKPTRQ